MLNESSSDIVRSNLVIKVDFHAKRAANDSSVWNKEEGVANLFLVDADERMPIQGKDLMFLLSV